MSRLETRNSSPLPTNKHHQLKFWIKIPDARLTSDLLVVNGEAKKVTANNYRVTAKREEEDHMIFVVNIKYNSQTKKVTPISTFLESSGIFITTSDCDREGNFCSEVHRFLSDYVWQFLYSPLFQLTNDILSTIKL